MNPLPALFVPFLFLTSWLDGWLGVYLDADRKEAVVTEVIPGSPAAKAGLEAGDVLLAVDATATPTREEFVSAIRAHGAGDRVKLKIRRDGQESVVAVRLAEREDEEARAGGEPPPPPIDKKPAAPPRPAIEVAPIEPVRPGKAAGKPYLGLSVRAEERAVVIERTVEGGPARKSGIEAGDRITKIDDTPVASLADIDRALAGKAPGQKIVLEVRNESGVRSVAFVLGERPDGDAAAPSQPLRTREAPRAVPPEAKPAPRAGAVDLEREVDALRRELQELRRELQELRERAGQPGRE